jgi:hypothetical protein
MNLKYLGASLLGLMFILLILKDAFDIVTPFWISIFLGISGFILLGIHHYKNKEFKKYALMHVVYLTIFIVLIITQLYLKN